ncbi:MAG: hypothetical protein P4M01_11155 [Acidobacteriota bacterium]|nr:hypothetical protein [Acidobacteriota bacterium]
MNSEEREELAERLLDRTLAHYADAEPPSGMKAHILQQLQREQARRATFSPLRLGWLAAAALLLAAALAPWHSLYKSTPPASGEWRRMARVEPSRTFVTPPEAPSRAVRSLSAAVAPRTSAELLRHLQPLEADSPRQERFPTPRPPSAQDRLLRAYVEQTPRQEILQTQARLADEREAEFKQFLANTGEASPSAVQ